MTTTIMPELGTTVRLYVSRRTSIVHTLHSAQRIAKRNNGAVVVWMRPSDGAVTYVWHEDGRTRRKARGVKAIRFVD